MEKTDMNNDKRVKVYEVGYLLVPTIAEENVAAEVEAIKAVITKNDGSVITEDFPKLRQLAYSMKKVVGSDRNKFDTAYFGWIKFETSPMLVPVIKAELDKNDKILRFMVVNTVRENTLISQRIAYKPADGTAPKKDEKMSEEEIDKTIENLVVE